MAIQIHQKKYDRQLLGQNKWRKAYTLGLSHSNGWGTWWWATGTGKTFASCDLASKILRIDPASTVIIVVPSENLEKQWKREVKAFIKPEYLPNISIYTIHKLVEMNTTMLCTLLIADEIHEYLTDERIRLFNGYVRPKYCVGLTATWEDSKGRHKRLEKIVPVVDRITKEEAIKEGFISKYVEYNLGITLTGNEQAKYDEYTKDITDNLSKFGRGGLGFTSGLDLAVACLNGVPDRKLSGYQVSTILATQKGWRKDMDMTTEVNQRIFTLWAPSKIMGYASHALESIKKRKDILYSASKKLDVARELVFKFDTLKAICFSQSTRFADRLGYIINAFQKELDPNSRDICVVYHSKLETIVVTDANGKQKKKGKVVLKREAIEAITSGTARIISTASSLDRGLDVKDIRMSITTSGTQNPTQYDQRTGRALRIESYDEDITVLIVNIYVRNSKDQEWLEKRQSKSNNVVYWVDTIDDITYNTKPQLAIPA